MKPSARTDKEGGYWCSPRPDTISTACPYCLVMLGDAVNAKKASGDAKDSLEVIDVAQLLVRSIRTRSSDSTADRSVT